MKNIIIHGARTHNLKNIDLSIPRDKLTVITGISGSGKSSLAFNTLYAEGQRRYVESLSAYARQFLSVMEKPEVELIEGLSPAISIEQKSTSHNPRSTVGTITEIYDYLRVLFARVGEPRCPTHKIPLHAQTITQMTETTLALPENTRWMLLAPIIRERKGEHQELLESLKSEGFIRVNINKKIYELENTPSLDPHKKHTIEVVIDRFKIQKDIKARLAESFETALKLSNGLAVVAPLDQTTLEPLLFSSQYACKHCGYSTPPLEPRLFSFNNPMGACPECNGLGVKEFFDEKLVVAHPELSLTGGAIPGWDKRNAFYYHILESLALHYQFDLSLPFKKLSKKIQQIILHGSGDEEVTFRYARFENTHSFEGILGNMKRRYLETDSEAVRSNLAHYLSIRPCEVCKGTRLKQEARHVFIGDVNLPDISNMSIDQALKFFQTLSLSGHKAEIAKSIFKEVCDRLKFLINVGLDYLTLSRSAETLSGGEAQRIRLASQIGASLVGVMYILDEPSIGLHQRDNARLLETLFHLRDLGNTVIVIEHDEEAIRSADHIVDIGPGAGVHGGYVIAEGSVDQIIASSQSLTGQYLSGKQFIETPKERVQINKKKQLSLTGATCHNLKNITLDIPIGLMTCVTGVSGSGKSSLINDTLYPIVAKHLNRVTSLKAGTYKSIEGLEHLDKVIDIDQSPIGRTPRSNPATYTGLFTPIRELFSQTPEARLRGYELGRFSFNVKGGRCEACSGDGVIRVEMHFLADVYVTCDQCHGKRYNHETLEIKYKNKNIHEVLEMTVEDARQFFSAIPILAQKLQTLIDVGLSYIKLGQSATTLSGGEAQRIKLSRELSKRDTGKTLYILDEPTTGLHFHDIKQLLSVLNHLRNQGNTIIIIEHNLDVIKTADWVIDLGPEGGNKGGKIIAVGTPEDIMQAKNSYTGQFLLANKNSFGK